MATLASIGRPVLVLAGATFVLMGLACIVAPDSAAELLQFSLSNPTARIDFIATYGGFELGFALFLLVCAAHPGRVHTGLLAIGFALAGFGLSRIIGLATTAGHPDPLLYLFLVLELSGAALSLLCARALAAAAPGAAGRAVLS